MLVMQIIMIVTVVLMEIVGISFLIVYLNRHKKIDKSNSNVVRNHKLDLMVSLLTIIGGIFIAIFIPFIG